MGASWNDPRPLLEVARGNGPRALTWRPAPVPTGAVLAEAHLRACEPPSKTPTRSRRSWLSHGPRRDELTAATMPVLIRSGRRCARIRHTLPKAGSESRGVAWKIRLNQHLARLAAATGPAGDLHDSLSEPLRCAKVSAEQALVGIENDYECYVREVVVPFVTICVPTRMRASPEDMRRMTSSMSPRRRTASRSSRARVTPGKSSVKASSMRSSALPHRLDCEIHIAGGALAAPSRNRSGDSEVAPPKDALSSGRRIRRQGAIQPQAVQRRVGA